MYMRSLEESNNHHATIPTKQLDVLVGVVSANIIEDDVDATIHNHDAIAIRTLCSPS